MTPWDNKYSVGADLAAAAFSVAHSKVAGAAATTSTNLVEGGLWALSGVAGEFANRGRDKVVLASHLADMAAGAGTAASTFVPAGTAATVLGYGTNLAWAASGVLKTVSNVHRPVEPSNVLGGASGLLNLAGAGLGAAGIKAAGNPDLASQFNKTSGGAWVAAAVSNVAGATASSWKAAGPVHQASDIEMQRLPPGQHEAAQEPSRPQTPAPGDAAPARGGLSKLD
jgi:hypothetical protein